MRLVILQQALRREKMSLNWLPAPPNLASGKLDQFDPGGALGLPAVSTPGILFEFFPTMGWEDFRQRRRRALQIGQG